MKKTSIISRKVAAVFWGIWRGYAYICMGVVPGYGLYTTMGSYRSGVSQYDFAEMKGFICPAFLGKGVGGRSVLSEIWRSPCRGVGRYGYIFVAASVRSVSLCELTVTHQMSASSTSCIFFG